MVSGGQVAIIVAVDKLYTTNNKHSNKALIGSDDSGTTLTQYLIFLLF